VGNSSRSGTVFIATGATVGAGVSTTVGGMGLAGSFGAIGVGAAPIVGAGAILGAAVYGATQALIDRDPFVYGSVGLGTLAGAGIAGTIGKMGLVAPKVGLAVGVGTLPIAMMGGICGLAAYGVAKMIDSGIPETPSQAIDRQAERIDWHADYVRALTDLTLVDLKWVDIELELRAATVEDELQTLKQKIQEITNPNIDFKTAKSNSNTSENTDSLKTPSVDTDSLKEKLDKDFNPDFAETIQAQSRSQWQLISTLKGHTAAVNSLAFSPDGQKLVSGSDDRTVNLWKLTTKKRFYSFFGAKDGISAVSFSPNGKEIAASSLDRTVTSWKVDDRQLLRSFLYLNSATSHSNVVNSIAYSPNGQTLASGSADCTVRLWSSSSGKINKTLDGHTDTVFTIAYSPNGQTLASGSADCTIRLWQINLSEDSQILTGHTGWVNTIAISPDGRILASGSTDRTIKIWNLNTGDEITTHRHHQAGIRSLAISTDNRTIASLDCDGLLRIWDLHKGEIQATLTGTGCVIFSPNGKTLAVGGKGGTIQIWHQIFAEDSISKNIILSGEWWEILGVNPDDTASQIKLVYLQLAKLYHPDLNSSTTALTYMQAINLAYQQFQQQR
jgi:WD40 repeat protein